MIASKFDTGFILKSTCRGRILQKLSTLNGVNIMHLVRSLNGTYNEVNRNLTILEKEGLVTQRYRGKQRLILLNFENEKTQLLLQIIGLLKIDHKEYAQKNAFQ